MTGSHAQRPVIPGFHPDPSVCRVGGTYYLATSSFEYAPGVPILASTDLRSWTQVGNVLSRPGHLALTGGEASSGILAPTLRHHGDRFWMITTNVTDGGGHLLVTAEDPAGPWSDPVRVTNAPGIDPDLAWDEDGTCYLTWTEFGRIVQAELDPEKGALLTEPRPLWQGTGGQFPEGPHLYRVGEHWYLLLAEGGTGQGHAVTIARGPAPWGPFEPCPHNPLLTARGIAAPVQNVGHADLVQRPDGSWAMVHLGVRTRGAFPGWHVLGRETFGVEIGWDSGWPYVKGPIEPTAPPSARAAEDAFTSETAALPPTWVRPNGFPEEVLSNSQGWRLRAPAHDPESGEDDVAFVGRRQQHLLSSFRAVVAAPHGTVGGTSIRIDPRHHLDLEVEGDEVRAVVRIGPARSLLGRCKIVSGHEVTLELRTEPADGEWFSSAFGPDRVVAALVRDDDVLDLGHIDGRYLSTELVGGYTGRLVGMWCARGELVVSSTRYEGTDERET
ncbi:family 43 glycosylhydrolase [Streptomyces sp. NPDC006172]|uniref:glycoside hydrolase family 43 protein n=1 Tax=Streptomyces sp. NPDC006172 TaxID=3154470 RepID=UPI0033E7764F